MVFSSITFLFIFLPVTLLGYYFFKIKLRNLLLLLVSLIFYSWGEPVCVWWMIVSIIFNYVVAILISHSREKVWISRLLLVFGILANLSVLFYFKYFNFTLEIIGKIFSVNYSIKDIALPIGISFYTFKNLSYLIDVSRGNIKYQKNILNYGVYVSFFPQIMAGPIERYSDMEDQLTSHPVSLDQMYDGATRFMLGFSKKILLSDQLSTFVGSVFDANGFSAPVAWLGAIAYTLQIYFDFSGYSDMAIGLGEMFGFTTKENFNYPYIAKSIQDFWRRWHISLSSWFRDYVYFPLGGSRCSKIRTYVNITVVFALTGLWHGASWNFIFWGFYYVIFLILERAGLKNILKKMPLILQHFYALLVICIGWIFFRASDLHSAILYLRNLIIFNDQSFQDTIRVIDIQLIVFIILGIVFSSSFSTFLLEKLKKNQVIYTLSVFIIFFISICFLWGNGFSPFLYFRF